MTNELLKIFRELGYYFPERKIKKEFPEIKTSHIREAIKQARAEDIVNYDTYLNRELVKLRTIAIGEGKEAMHRAIEQCLS